jgi:hypothetical protein
MKRILLATAIGLVSTACGGGGGPSFKDPDAVLFTFGAPQAVVADSPEQGSADAGAGSLADALAFVGETDDTAAQNLASNAAMMPNRMSDVFGDGVPVPTVRALQQGETAVVRQGLATLLAGAALSAGPVWSPEGCWTVSSNRVTFDHCSTPLDDPDVTGSIVVNGSFNREAGHVFWDVTFSIHATGQDDGGGPISMSASDRLHGDLVFDAVGHTIVGFSRSDLAFSLSASGRSARAAVTYNADYDLVYEVDPATCVSGGTLTLKRVWGEVPSEAAGDPDFEDAAVQFTWLGCGLVQIAYPVN